jgi:hypothetical protein
LFLPDFSERVRAKKKFQFRNQLLLINIFYLKGDF